MNPFKSPGTSALNELTQPLRLRPPFLPVTRPLCAPKGRGPGRSMLSVAPVARDAAYGAAAYGAAAYGAAAVLGVLGEELLKRSG